MTNNHSNNIIIKYPTSYEDLEFFANWQMEMGKFDTEIQDLLHGMFCINDNYTWEEKLVLARNAEKFVTSWRRFCEYQIKRGKEDIRR